MLTFKKDGKNYHNSRVVDSVIRNAAVALNFSYSLSYDPAFSTGAERIKGYIEERDLWSQRHVERVLSEKCVRVLPPSAPHDGNS